MPFPELLYGHYPLLPFWKKDLAVKRNLDYMQAGRSMEFDLNDAISYLVCSKALDPASMRFTFNTKDDFLGAPAKDCGLHQLYSCYDFLSENKDSLFKWVNAKMDKLYGANRATLVFYDVTNTYFEAPLTDAERDYERVDVGFLHLKRLSARISASFHARCSSASPAASSRFHPLPSLLAPRRRP